MQRRHFLQGIGAVGAASMAPFALAEAASGASPIAASDGVLVLITMSGGCDSLDYVVPIANSSYYQAREGLAIPAASTHAIDASRGLHPALSAVKERWDRGQVAIIEGVGDPAGNLSHFDNAARVMAGRTGEGVRSSGWLGRYMDELPQSTGPYYGISFGSSVPLDSLGNRRKAVGLHTRHNFLSNPRTADEFDSRQINAFGSFGASGRGRGELTDLIAQANLDAVQLGNDVAPLFNPDLPSGELASQMVMAARLINANLGIRVLSLNFGDFDGHARHRSHHDEGMTELNDGIQKFLDELDYEFLDQVMLLTTTEFGRRVRPNNSGGTDHGAAATYMAIGTQVKGGIYGQSPSLTNLDSHHNLRVHTDYRSVYATVLDTWLKSDSFDILGGNYENLGFTHAPATVDPGPHPSFAAGLERRDQVIRLYLAYFLRMPDSSGLDYWIGQRMRGASLDAVSNALSGSPEFMSRYGQLSNRDFVKLVYRNVLNRSADAPGENFWTSELDRGVQRGQVMTGFSDSTEYRGNTANRIADFDVSGPIARLYHAYFLRAPERGGRDYWNSTGRPLGEVSQAFAESAEFQGRYGALTNAEFVSLIYQNVLKRPAEGTGFSFWTGQLDQGLSRGGIMVHFSEAPEFIAQFA